MDKAQARAEARTLRRSIPPEARTAKDARVADAFLDLPELRAAQTVGCYVAVGSEVDTRLILRGLLARGHVVAVPAAPDVGMRFVRLDHPWALVPGAYGIPEPRQPWTEIPGDDLDLVAVPGLRFDRLGNRLGNGGGHFDRFLHAHPRPRRVGLAYEEQVVDRLDVEAHDKAMDALVTDAGVLRFPPRR